MNSKAQRVSVTLTQLGVPSFKPPTENKEITVPYNGAEFSFLLESWQALAHKAMQSKNKVYRKGNQIAEINNTPAN